MSGGCNLRFKHVRKRSLCVGARRGDARSSAGGAAVASQVPSSLNSVGGLGWR